MAESAQNGAGPLRRVLITGITGQDGGYLAEQLAERGAQIHGLVREGDPGVALLAQRVPAAQLHTGDLLAQREISELVRRIEPDAVLNLAGVSSVAQSWTEPVLTAEVTGVAVATVLQAAWDLTSAGKPVRFLQASSAEMFGNPDSAPQDESTPLRPVSPYGAAKAFAHLLVGVYRGRGLHASTAILYNHESPRRPPQFVTRKITSTVARIAKGSGEQLRLGNLDARRDWGWAPDYVDAMLRAVEHDEPGDYVIATGQAHSVREFVAAAFAAAGVSDWQDRVVVDPEFFRPVDSVELVGDPGRARRVLGWTPSVGFADLVARMVQHDLAELSSQPADLQGEQ